VSAGINPRFVAFCRATGRPLDARGPSTMAAFIAWIGEQIAAWRAATGQRCHWCDPVYDHPAFDRWLAEVQP